jgi:hypothetical protein
VPGRGIESDKPRAAATGRHQNEGTPRIDRFRSRG